jgi:hypothetical protein
LTRRRFNPDEEDEDMIPVEIEAAGFELPQVLAANLAGWRHEGWRRIRGREFLALHERLNARAERVLLPFAIRKTGPWQVACLEVIPATRRVILCDPHGRAVEEHESLGDWPPFSGFDAPKLRAEECADCGRVEPIFVEGRPDPRVLVTDLRPLFVPEDRFPTSA